jgi:hypothetical protein
MNGLQLMCPRSQCAAAGTYRMKGRCRNCMERVEGVFTKGHTTNAVGCSNYWNDRESRGENEKPLIMPRTVCPYCECESIEWKELT